MGKIHNRPSVIYILGSGHSGSTILQYLLAGQPNVLGLGEVKNLIDLEGHGIQNASGFCSCGSSIEDCRIWGKAKYGKGEVYYGRYLHLSEVVKQEFPDTTHWIDSSKSLDGIAPWVELMQTGVIDNIKVLYLIRDVRGWAVSDKSTRLRKGRFVQPVLVSMFKWWLSQHKKLRFLRSEKIGYDFRVVSYESLVFNTNAILSKITDFSGISVGNKDWEGALKYSAVHDVTGNRMKDNPETRNRITYDDRWHYCMSANLFPFVFLPIWRLNMHLHKLGGI